MKPFANVPTVIAALHDDIHFFKHRLADVPGEQLVVAAAVERNAPGVAHSVGKNFRAAFLAVGERIVRRKRARISLVHVDAQDFAKQHGRVLAVALRRMAPAFVVRVAAIADGDIKIAIRPEGEAARVVVEIRLVDLQQHAL